MSTSVEKLHHLSVVSKVCQELDRHLNMSDKTLAEYIIHLARKHTNEEEFQKELNKAGSDFSPSLASSLHRLVLTLLPPKPKKKKKKKGKKKKKNKEKAGFGEAVIKKTEEEKKFPGLARPNTAPVDAAHLFDDDRGGARGGAGGAGKSFVQTCQMLGALATDTDASQRVLFSSPPLSSPPLSSPLVLSSFVSPPLSSPLVLSSFVSPPLPSSTLLYPPLPSSTLLYPPLPSSTLLYPPLPSSPTRAL